MVENHILNYCKITNKMPIQSQMINRMPSYHFSSSCLINSIIQELLFKFVDFLYSISEVFDRVTKVISSENIFFSLSFDV